MKRIRRRLLLLQGMRKIQRAGTSPDVYLAPSVTRISRLVRSRIARELLMA
jgi:hypothetical protein